MLRNKNNGKLSSNIVFDEPTSLKLLQEKIGEKMWLLDKSFQSRGNQNIKHSNTFPEKKKFNGIL